MFDNSRPRTCKYNPNEQSDVNKLKQHSYHHCQYSTTAVVNSMTRGNLEWMKIRVKVLTRLFRPVYILI